MRNAMRQEPRGVNQREGDTAQPISHFIIYISHFSFLLSHLMTIFLPFTIYRPFFKIED